VQAGNQVGDGDEDHAGDLFQRMRQHFKKGRAE
jgi:hypothetical protein